MLEILIVKKKKPDKKVSITAQTYQKYFNNKNNDEVQKIIEQALELYFSSGRTFETNEK